MLKYIGNTKIKAKVKFKGLHIHKTSDSFVVDVLCKKMIKFSDKTIQMVCVWKQLWMKEMLNGSRLTVLTQVEMDTYANSDKMLKMLVSLKPNIKKI